jgi:hypothetical protein
VHTLDIPTLLGIKQTTASCSCPNTEATPDNGIQSNLGHLLSIIGHASGNRRGFWAAAHVCASSKRCTCILIAPFSVSEIKIMHRNGRARTLERFLLFAYIRIACMDYVKTVFQHDLPLLYTPFFYPDITLVRIVSGSKQYLYHDDIR